MTLPQSSAPQYSALQLAWLQELGIEKPWLPQEQPAPIKINVQSTVAAVVPQPKRPVTTAPSRIVAPVIRPVLETQVDTLALAAAAHDVASLAATVRACEACGLCRERQQAVPGEGIMSPAIMVIGEAPGVFEDREGRPFVDRPGLMLDNMLSAIQSSRSQHVFVSNIVKCRPPGNRNPKPAELEACKPFLLRQIELVRPFSILAVGRAAQSLLGSEEPLANLRQVTHGLMVAGQKIPLIATYHPFHLLSHPGDKAAAWQDLQLLKTVAGL